jgi:hypothetical protein
MPLYIELTADKNPGLPEGSPVTNSYFSHPLHHNDQYSIAISFVPKQLISGDDLVFGNDFDRPIRDRLPPGFNAALRIVKWIIDPGLDGDAYADKPYLYGPALSSWNYFRIGEKRSQDATGSAGSDNAFMTSDFHDEVVEEGGRGSGEKIRKDLNIPDQADQRKKWFLNQRNRQAFEFEEGRVYKADFGNPYLVFNGEFMKLNRRFVTFRLLLSVYFFMLLIGYMSLDFSVRLPGFTLRVIKYVDEKTHELRYVLKNRRTGDVYFVILFTLVHIPSSKENSPTGSNSSSRNGSVRSSRSFDSDLVSSADDVD